MTTRRRAFAAHAAEVAALGLGLVAGCLLVASVALTDGVLLGGVEPLVGSAVFAVVGVVLAARLPANPIGWLLLTSAVCVAGQEAANAWWETQVAAAPAIEGPALAIAWLSTWLWIPGVALVPVFSFLLFPGGRLPSRVGRRCCGAASQVWPCWSSPCGRPRGRTGGSRFRREWRIRCALPAWTR